MKSGKQERKEATSQSQKQECGLGADSAADTTCRVVYATLESELHTGWQGDCPSHSDIKVKGWLPGGRKTKRKC